MSSEWLAWQIVDSAFPTGAFAHSWGLESAWQHGEVPDAPALESMLRDVLQQVAYGSLPLVTAAHRHPERLEPLDQLADAFLTNIVSNRASRVQGRALVATAARIWPSPSTTALASRAAGLHAHAAPLTGATFRTIGLALPVTQRIALFGAARGVLAAAVRLGIAGSYEAQRMQSNCAPWLDDLLVRCGHLDEHDIAQTAPVLDMLQAAHDRLYSRLFQS